MKLNAAAILSRMLLQLNLGSVFVLGLKRKPHRSSSNASEHNSGDVIY